MVPLPPRSSALLLSGALLLLTAGRASATPISISLWVEPGNLYPNTDNNPCIFYGTHDGPANKCNGDAAAWYPVVGPTGSGGTGDFDLVDSFSDLTIWNTFVGSTFVVGFDANEASVSQSLNYFDIFFDGVLAYSLSGPLQIPATNNGEGWADYVLSAGCLSSSTVAGSTYERCDTDGFIPFVAPTGTSTISFRMGFTGNDGPDTVFALTEACPQGSSCSPIFPPPPPTPVPEPGSLFLVGTGLSVGIARLRRKSSRR